MTSTVDANEVRVTGENSFVRLAAGEGGEFTTRASHWRVLYSPAGAGHALFLQSELTDGKVVAYTDNVAVARWLQGEIEPMLHAPFADTECPVVEASFSRSGDIRSVHDGAGEGKRRGGRAHAGRTSSSRLPWPLRRDWAGARTACTPSSFPLGRRG